MATEAAGEAASEAAEGAKNVGNGLVRAGTWTAKQVWNRVTPLEASGIYTTLGLSALFVTGTVIAAPAAFAATMPAVTLITPGATVGANALSLAAAGGQSVLAAGTVAFNSASGAITTAMAGSATAEATAGGTAALAPILQGPGSAAASTVANTPVLSAA